MITIKTHDLSVEIATLGAELQSIVGADGRSWLWSGDAAHWSNRAPLLFPVVGRNPDEQALIEGQLYPMERHGFTRTSEFRVIETSETSCVLRLSDSDATRISFPYAFYLDVKYSVTRSTLTTQATVTNRDQRPMPFGFGYHPAFVWPLPGAAGQPHVVRLDNQQEPLLRRADANGLMLPARTSSPFNKGVLALSYDQFEDGAMVFDADIGESIWFGNEGKTGVRVRYPGMPYLGLWTKPDAPFLCIEPWHGLPADQGERSELAARPGSTVLAPGASKAFVMDITVDAAA